MSRIILDNSIVKIVLEDNGTITKTIKDGK